jgi:hypothetical protein
MGCAAYSRKYSNITEIFTSASTLKMFYWSEIPFVFRTYSSRFESWLEGTVFTEIFKDFLSPFRRMLRHVSASPCHLMAKLFHKSNTVPGQKMTLLLKHIHSKEEISVN